MTTAPDNEKANIVLAFDSYPDLEFHLVLQGPNTKTALVFAQLVDSETRVATLPVDATRDGRETIYVVEDACRMFALGYQTMKASRQGKEG